MTQTLYSVEEAAQLLGVKETTIRKWLYVGEIKGIKEGGWRVKIPNSEIIRIKERKMTSEKYEPKGA